MRILFLTQWFDPEPAFKGLAFARELKKRGHDLLVVTGFPNYPGGNIYPGYRVRPWARERMEDIPILRVPLYPSHDNSAFRRALNYASFAVSASSLGWMLSKKPDIIYAYHPPGSVGLPALVGKVMWGVPVVYDIQDLWPDSVVATKMVENRSLLRLLDRWCNFVYRSVDRIVVLSPGFRQTLIDRGIDQAKIDVIYNWSDETPIPDGAQSAFSLGADTEFKVLFAGTMGRAQALDAVLDAARICMSSLANARFILVGGGVDRDRLQRRAAELALKNVTFLPRQPASAMSAILAAADALLVHLKDEPLFRITIPSKTQAYMAAGKPIIAGVRGDAAELIRRAGAGLICEPDNAESIAGAVAELAALDADRRAEMGFAGRNYYWRELSLSVGVDRFEQVFRAAIA